MIPRLATRVLVGALVRQTEAQGGFAAVLARGDPDAGSLLVILTEKGANPRILERLLGSDGHYRWESPFAGGAESSSVISDFIARRRRFDPDLWVLELDVPSGERFAAVMNEAG